MSKNHDKFIEIYKELERILPTQVRDYEETLSEDDKNRLRLCRMLRNYIQHQKDYESFVAITDGMISFVSEVVRKEKLKDGCAKDHMVSAAKFGIMPLSSTVLEVAEMLKKKKRDYTYLVDEKTNDVYHISKADISDAFADGLTKTTKVSKLNLIVSDIERILSDAPVNVETLSSSILIVNKSGKIVGVIEV